MQLFVYEHTTSGALIDNTLAADSIIHEGNEMLLAVLRECCSLAVVDPVILRDSRLPLINFGNNNADVYIHIVETKENYLSLWQQCLAESDAVLIIAPETDNSLYQLHQQAMAFDSVILGCQLDAIMLASNKLYCDKHLKYHAIPAAPSCSAQAWQNASFDAVNGYIVKPVDGAGCIDTLIFNDKAQLEQYLLWQDEQVLRQTLIQGYVEGIALSLSLLISKADVLVLAINRQYIRQNDNMLTFHGCLVNDLDSHYLTLSQSTSLAQQVKQAIPGLWGFVGIDIVLGSGGPIIVDINPRLTSAYLGVGRSLSLNLIALLLTMKSQGIDALPAISQRQQVDISL